MLLNFLQAIALSADPPIYPVAFPIVRSDPAYNRAYKVSFDGAKISSNADPNPNAPLENAIKDNWDMWECYNWPTGGIYVIITWSKPVEFSRFVFQARTNTDNRGFPKRYRLFIKKKGENDFKLVKNSYFSQKTGEPVLIDFGTLYTDVIAFKINYDDIYFTYENKFVSLIYLGFYNDDKGYELKDTVFVDGTYSKFKPDFDITEFRETINNYSVYTQNYFKYNVALNRAMDEVVNTYPEMLEKDIFEFSCLGDMNNEKDRLKTNTVHHSYMPIGRYLRNQEFIELFCDFGNNTVYPGLALLKHMDTDGDRTIRLNNGYNKIWAPNFGGQSSKIMYPMLECNLIIGWKGFEYKHPRCRVKGGHRFPQFLLFKSDSQHYYDELIEYQKKVTNIRSKMLDNSFRADLTVTVSNKHIFLGTATGAYKGYRQNMPLDNALLKLVKNYDRYPYVYYFYGGFAFTPNGRFFSRVNDNFINDVHAYDHPFYTVYNCQCLNKEDQTSVWSANVFSTKQMTTTTDNSWGYFHEWGHGMDNSEIVVVEMTNNYYTQALSRFVARAGAEWYEQGIEPFMEGFYGKNPITNAQWQGMSQMRQLELYFGPNLHALANQFVRVNRNYADNGFTKPGVGQQRWIIACCCVTKANLNDYFINVNWFWWNNFDTNEGIRKIQEIISNKFQKPKHHVEYMSPGVRAYVGRGDGRNKPGFVGSVKPVVLSVKFKGSGTKTVSLSLNDTEAIKILQGFEIKNMKGKVIAFTMKRDITIPNEQVEIVPYDKRLSPGTSIYFDPENKDIVHLPKTGWTVENFPGVVTWSGVVGSLGLLIDGNPATSYRNGGGKPNGFIFDLAVETTFSGFSRVRRDDYYGNTKQYKIYYSNNKKDWTQINSNADQNTLSTSGATEEFYFFGKTITAKYIKYESVATVGGDSHLGMSEFSLVSGFNYNVEEGKVYPKNTEPFPDISNLTDMDTFQPHEPNIKDELYSHYPDFYDQPCFSQFGTTKTHRKKKVFNRDAALYALDTFEKVVDLEIEHLIIKNNAKVITQKLIVTTNLQIEKGSRLFADLTSSINFGSNCSIDLYIDEQKLPILEIGNMNVNKLPKSINVYLELPSEGDFDFKIIKGNEDALRSIRDSFIIQVMPNSTVDHFFSVNDGYISITPVKDDDEPDPAQEDKDKKHEEINDTTIVIISIMVVIVIVIICIILGLIMFKRRYMYIDSESFNQLAI